MSGDVSAAPPSALEVVSFIGKTVGAGAALTAAVYLLRKVCLIMAWKSGGANHAELVNNLRSKCTHFVRRWRRCLRGQAARRKRGFSSMADGNTEAAVSCYVVVDLALPLHPFSPNHVHGVDVDQMHASNEAENNSIKDTNSRFFVYKCGSIVQLQFCVRFTSPSSSMCVIQDAAASR